MRGIAKNTAANREYLEACPAVTKVTETDDEMVQFTFDPELQPAEGQQPEGVYFDLAVAPF